MTRQCQATVRIHNSQENSDGNFHRKTMVFSEKFIDKILIVDIMVTIRAIYYINVLKNRHVGSRWNMQKRVLSLLVDNTAGVTTRVSGLFSRRGYNIDSITGGVTADERFSRITVVCSGDELILEQITNQLAKLVDVRDIKILEPDNSVCHELMMIKVLAKPEQRQGLISIADVFHAKVADVSVDSMILEMTGNHKKLEAFLELMGDYEILELARTGTTGLSRGSQDVTYF